MPTKRHPASRLAALCVWAATALGAAAGLAWPIPLQENSAVRPAQDSSTPSLRFESEGDRVRVFVGDELVTTVVTNQYAKPILYPLMMAGKIPVTRGGPMEPQPGEAQDHPHHKSVWFAHGHVNGVDFWSEKGTIRTTRAVVNPETSTIELDNDWLAGEQRICRDHSHWRFGVSGPQRWIDFDFDLQASEGEVKFGDTKEGTWAIRTRPGLQLTADPKSGVNDVFGHALNSVGDRDLKVWGKRAAWVLYTGKLDGVSAAVMMMDHPQNLRHPTTWHARDYGLIAANPFGLHDFLGEPVGAGDYTLPKGQSLRLRYRLLWMNQSSGPLVPEQAYRDYVDAVSEER